MPKAARFQSERTQKAVVGAVTLLLFAAALGGAHLYTQSRQINWEVSLRQETLGELTIVVPDGWVRQKTAGHFFGFTSDATEYFDTQVRDRKLIIGRIDALSPQSPDEVLREFLQHRTLHGSKALADQGEKHRERIGPFIVVRYTAQTLVESTATATDRIIVFTENGRRHWMVWLRMPITTNTTADGSNDLILRQMIASAKDTAERDAADADWSSALLAPVKLEGWRSRVETGPRGPQPILIMPDSTGTQHLAMLRVHGELNTVGHSNDVALSPELAMSRQFFEAHGEMPGSESLIKEERGGRQAWRLNLTPDPAAVLRRELVYVMITPQRGVVIEALAEKAAWSAVQGQIDPLIAAMAAKMAAGSTGADDTLLAVAQARGEKIAQAQRHRSSDQSFAVWSYWRIWRDQRLLGTQISFARRPAPQGLLLSLRLRILLTESDLIEATQDTWRATADGRLFHGDLFQERLRANLRTTTAYRVELKDGTLAMRPYPMIGELTEGWSATAPAALLPSFAEETWSMDEVYNLAGNAPALIWRSRGEAKPVPCWLTVTRLPQADGPSAAPATTNPPATSSRTPTKAVVVLALRPMMTQDADRLWLDESGRVVRAECHETVYDGRRFPIGGVRLTLVPSDEATVSRDHALNRNAIQRWNQEANTP